MGERAGTGESETASVIPSERARTSLVRQISYAVIVATEQSSALQLPDVELEGFVSAKSIIIEDEEEDVKPVLHPIFQRSVSSSSSEATPAAPTRARSKSIRSTNIKRDETIEVADPGLELEYDEEDEDFVLLDSIDKLPTTEAISGGIDVRYARCLSCQCYT